MMTLEERQTIHLAAERGALFLDMKLPDWYQRIDLRMLAISTVDHCILGQLFGSYSDGMSELGLAFGGLSAALGFVCEGTGYMALNDAWRKEIRARRSEAKAA